MKIILHGQLKKAFGASFDIEADCAEDAIRGLTNQIPDWPTELVIDVPGFDTVQKLEAKTDAREIHLVPALEGGGGKFFSIVLGAALIAAVVFSGPLGLGAAMATTIGAGAGAVTVGAVAVGLGASLVLNGVMQFFMKAPSISRSNDPDASKYLGVTKNTTAIGTRIKLAWGLIPPGGHYLSIQGNSDRLVHAVWPTNPT